MVDALLIFFAFLTGISAAVFGIAGLLFGGPLWPVPAHLVPIIVFMILAYKL